MKEKEKTESDKPEGTERTLADTFDQIGRILMPLEKSKRARVLRTLCVFFEVD